MEGKQGDGSLNKELDHAFDERTKAACGRYLKGGKNKELEFRPWHCGRQGGEIFARRVRILRSCHCGRQEWKGNLTVDFRSLTVPFGASAEGTMALWKARGGSLNKEFDS